MPPSKPHRRSPAEAPPAARGLAAAGERRRAVSLSPAGLRSSARGDVVEEVADDPVPRSRVAESEKITINLGAVDLGSIDLLVAEGFFSNRSDLIRTAVRNLLAAHRDIINGAVMRQDRTLGLRRITRAELAQRTIAELSVLGSLQASADVRRALAGRLA